MNINLIMIIDTPMKRHDNWQLRTISRFVTSVQEVM